MLWALVLAGGTGFVVGLGLRVPALVVASALTTLISVIVVPLAQWSLTARAAYTVALLCLLQWGYLAGATLLAFWYERQQIDAVPA